MSLMMQSRQTTLYAYACVPQHWTEYGARKMPAQCRESQLLWPAVIPQDARADGRHGRS